MGAALPQASWLAYTLGLNQPESVFTNPREDLVYRWTVVVMVCALLGAVACGGDSKKKQATPQDMGAEDMGMGDAQGDLGEDTAPDMDEGDMEEPLPEGFFIEGLDGAVEVNFDAQGVLHLRCESDNDCFAAQGYFHAAHRFAQMDLRRRLARGRLSTLLVIRNEGAINVDIGNRIAFSGRRGELMLEEYYQGLSQESRASLEAYSRGVNAWLRDLRQGRNEAQLSEEFGFFAIKGSPEDIPDWEGVDSLASGLLLLNDLANRSRSDILRGMQAELYGPELAHDLHSPWHLDPDSTIIEATGNSYPANQDKDGGGLGPVRPDVKGQALLRRAGPALAMAQQRLEAGRLPGMGDFEGSNSWVTSARSLERHPILSNDPHLSLSNPSLWYLNELDGKSEGEGSFHAAGVTFAGFPGVHIGYGEEVAWSATVAFWDLSDVYVEELSEDGQGVVFNGEVVPFVRRTDVIEHATGTQEVEQLFVPHHGPVVAYDAEAGVAVSVKTVLQDARQDVDFFLGLGRMTSMEQAREHFKLSQAAAFSFVLASRDGQIAYFPFADIPNRAWDTVAMPPRYPLPGTGEYEWGEYLDKDTLPQLLNPEVGFIATANAGITDDTLDGELGNAGYPLLQDAGLYRGARQARIIDQIREYGDEHTVDTHAQIQADNTLWEAQELVPEILASSEGAQLSPEAAALRTVLEGWNHACPTGLASSDPQGEPSEDEAERSASVGCSAYHVTVFALSDLMLGDEVQAANPEAAPSYYELRPLYWALKDPSKLARQSGWWDNVNTDGPDETREQIVAAALERAAGELEGLFGSSEPEAWLWGRIHTVTLKPDLLSTLTDEFDNGPYAGPGGYGSVNVANPEVENGYSYDAGPSMRMIVDVRPEGMVGRFALPGGLVHRRDADNYDNLMQRWLAVEYFDMPFTVEQVDAASASKVEIQPVP